MARKTELKNPIISRIPEKKEKINFMVSIDKDLFEKAKIKKRQMKQTWEQIITSSLEVYLG